MSDDPIAAAVAAGGGRSVTLSQDGPGVMKIFAWVVAIGGFLTASIIIALGFLPWDQQADEARIRALTILGAMAAFGCVVAPALAYATPFVGRTNVSVGPLHVELSGTGQGE